jgi:hypothetical protein
MKSRRSVHARAAAILALVAAALASIILSACDSEQTAPAAQSPAPAVDGRLGSLKGLPTSAATPEGTRGPTAGEILMSVKLPTATAAAAPSKTSAAPAAAATLGSLKAVATVAANAGSKALDARGVIVTEGDLEKGWVLGRDERLTQMKPEHAGASFDWAGQGSNRQNPEGLVGLLAEVDILADAHAALASMEPESSEYTPISAPTFGDSSRAYTRSIDNTTQAIYLEAVIGNIRLEVDVYGSPQAETKVTTAAKLMMLMMSRLPK